MTFMVGAFTLAALAYVLWERSLSSIAIVLILLSLLSYFLDREHADLLTVWGLPRYLFMVLFFVFVPLAVGTSIYSRYRQSTEDAKEGGVSNNT